MRTKISDFKKLQTLVESVITESQTITNLADVPDLSSTSTNGWRSSKYLKKAYDIYEVHLYDVDRSSKKTNNNTSVQYSSSLDKKERYNNYRSAADERDAKLRQASANIQPTHQTKTIGKARQVNTSTSSPKQSVQDKLRTVKAVINDISKYWGIFCTSDRDFAKSASDELKKIVNAYKEEYSNNQAVVEILELVNKLIRVTIKQVFINNDLSNVNKIIKTFDVRMEQLKKALMDNISTDLDNIDTASAAHQTSAAPIKNELSGEYEKIFVKYPTSSSIDLLNHKLDEYINDEYGPRTAGIIYQKVKTVQPGEESFTGL